jgi:hypothetical protein
VRARDRCSAALPRTLPAHPPARRPAAAPQGTATGVTAHAFTLTDASGLLEVELGPPGRRRPAALAEVAEGARVVVVGALFAPPAPEPRRVLAQKVAAGVGGAEVSSAAFLSCQSNQKTANQPTNQPITHR